MSIVYGGPVNADSNFLDFSLSDDENPRVSYILTWDRFEERWSGLILRSDTDDGAFEHDERMPPHVVNKMRIFIPAEDLGR